MWHISLGKLPKIFKVGLRFEATALLAIQEAMEAWLVPFDGGHEFLCDSCQEGYHWPEGFVSGMPY